ncbi:Arc family DNA-binding protein [Tianweitania populi]|uniref:Arc-like DNA binding domain-containing protein n=1 Tax=Tianweitania populi TaxID=1607949 RepID=A0A8J3DLS5_9HYPH|nr:hypothetical protein GCM10016234_06490 [Tianweitania populi]
MAKRAKVSEFDQFVVRLPNGMRDQLKARASERDRSMNSEIVDMLETCLRAPPNAQAQMSDETIAALQAEVATLRHHLEFVVREFAEQSGIAPEQVNRIVTTVRLLGTRAE